MRKQLRQLRIRRGLTVDDVASAVGISVSHYYKIEQGRRNPTIAVARNIANILGSTVDMLFFTSGLDDASSEAPPKATA